MPIPAILPNPAATPVFSSAAANTTHADLNALRAAPVLNRRNGEYRRTGIDLHVNVSFYLISRITKDLQSRGGSKGTNTAFKVNYLKN